MNTKEVQTRHGAKWETLFTDSDPARVYQSLSNDLIAKKLCGCSYIKSIRRTQNYNGTITITVIYQIDANSEPTRALYTVDDH